MLAMTHLLWKQVCQPQSGVSAARAALLEVKSWKYLPCPQAGSGGSSGQPGLHRLVSKTHRRQGQSTVIDGQADEATRRRCFRRREFLKPPVAEANQSDPEPRAVRG